MQCEIWFLRFDLLHWCSFMMCCAFCELLSGEGAETSCPTSCSSLFNTKFSGTKYDWSLRWYGMGGIHWNGTNKTDEYCEALGSILSSKDVRKVSPVRWAWVGFVLPDKAYLQPEAVKKDVILLDEHELAVFHSICYAHSLISSTFAPRLVAPVTTKDSLFADTDTATSLLLISIWMYRPLIMLLLRTRILSHQDERIFPHREILVSISKWCWVLTILVYK